MSRLVALLVGLVIGGFPAVLLAQSGATPVPGAVDPGFNPGAGLGATPSISAVVRQADGKILVAGAFSYLGGSLRQGLVRLNPDGRLDPAFQATEIRVAAERVALQPDGKILISIPSPVAANPERTELLRLNADGSRDPGFQTGTVFDFRLNALVLQPDGKVLVGLAGSGAPVRLLSNGQRDFTFVALTGFEFGVTALAVQADGKIWVGGYFNTVDGRGSTRLVRLLPDGRLDLAFPSDTPDDASFFSGYIRALLIQSGGKILVVGAFTPVGASKRQQGLTRLNANGTLDPSFHPAQDLASAANNAVVQGDGKLLVNVPTPADFLFPPPIGAGGGQRTVSSFAAAATGPDLARSVVVTSNVYRFLPDGGLDPGFVPVTIFGPPAGDDVVTSLTLQTAGRILVGGRFDAVNGFAQPGLGQLEQNGTLSKGFKPSPQLPGFASALLPLPDGGVVVGGSFATAGESLHANLARFQADGSVDESFFAETDGNVSALARNAEDGAILLAGDFQHVNGVQRPGLARINASGALDVAYAPAAALDFFPRALAVQADGKVLVGGFRNVFSSDLPVPLVRLNRDGSLDAGFRTAFSGAASITGLAVQADGGILVSGRLPDAGGGTFSNQLVRLTPNGERDAGFDAAAALATFPVSSFLLQADGKILVNRGEVAATPTGETSILRLLPDGRRDAGFAATQATAAAVQSDGKILALGPPDPATATTTRVMRLNGDGSPDPGFHSPVFDEPYSSTPAVNAVAVLAHGDVLAGGSFSLVDGGVHQGLVRLSGGPTVPWFFAGQVSIGNHAYYLDFLGGYRWDYFPCVYFPDLGFEYFFDARDSARGAYFYDFGLRSFLYTAPACFPYLYDFNAGAFLYYFRGTSHPRVFANLKTGQFVFSE